MLPIRLNYCNAEKAYITEINKIYADAFVKIMSGETYDYQRKLFRFNALLYLLDKSIMYDLQDLKKCDTSKELLYKSEQIKNKLKNIFDNEVANDKDLCTIHNDVMDLLKRTYL